MELTIVLNESLTYMSSFALRCAADLNIADHIQAYGRPMPLDELARSIPILSEKDTSLGRLMALLVHKEIFAQDEAGYVLTPVSKLLLTEHSNMGAVARYITEPHFTKLMGAMSKWFKEGAAGSTVNTTANGVKPSWDLFKEKPEFGKMFNEAMASRCKEQMRGFAKNYPHIFDGLNSLVDVGGNTGAVVKIIAKAFPFLRCTVLDLPHVVAEANLEDGSFDVVGGSMLEKIPPAEAFLIKNVLHDWRDKDCVAILKRCKEAFQPRKDGSKVIIVDIIQDFKNNSPKAIETGHLFDLFMMCAHGSKERKEQEWKDIILRAGYSGYKILPTKLGVDCVMELYP